MANFNEQLGLEIGNEILSKEDEISRQGGITFSLEDVFQRAFGEEGSELLQDFEQQIQNNPVFQEILPFDFGEVAITPQSADTVLELLNSNDLLEVVNAQGFNTQFDEVIAAIEDARDRFVEVESDSNEPQNTEIPTTEETISEETEEEIVSEEDTSNNNPEIVQEPIIDETVDQEVVEEEDITSEVEPIVEEEIVPEEVEEPAEPIDVNEALELNVETVETITEDSVSEGTVIGNASASDEDGGDITFSIDDTTNYAIDPESGEITLTETGAALVNSGEDLPTFTVHAESTTGNTSEAEAEVSPVATTDVNDAITQVVDTDDSANNVDSNVVDGTYTGITLSASDEDGDTITYSIEGDVPFRVEEDGRVVVDGDNTIDFNEAGSYSFDVVATSSDGTTSTQTVSVDVNDIETSITANLDSSSDSGENNSDNITNDNTPTITGSGEAGATVVITDANGAEVGTGVVGEDGTYSITTSELPEGDQTLTITATDIAGNTAVESVEMTIDTTASDTDSLAITNIVDNDGDYTSVTMSGTGAEVGNTVTVYDEDNNEVGITTVGEDGTWSLEIANASGTPVNDNEVFSVSETDSAGNETAQTDSTHYWHGNWSGAITEDSDDFVMMGDGNDTAIHDTAYARYDTVSGDDSNDMTVIDGGDGTDTVRMSGSMDDYTISTNDEGHLVLAEGSESDSDGDGTGDITELRNVETVEFADGTYDVASGTFTAFDFEADAVTASIDVGDGTAHSISNEVVDQDATEAAGVYERDGNYYTTETQDVDTGVVDTSALRELGFTMDSDGNFYEIDDDAPKQLIEQEVETEVTRVVDAEPIMKVASEATTYETLGEDHVDEGSLIAKKSGMDFDFAEPTSNIEIDFGNFDTGTAKISFYDAEGNQVGDTLNTSHTNGAEGYTVPDGAVGVTVYNNTNSNDFEVESISYRGEPGEVTVEAGGLVPDYDAMEEAGIFWSDTESATIVQTADITNIGNVGNNQVDGFNPEDHETSQVFDFGPELANRMVTITVDMEVKGSWDNSESTTNDYFSVSANGQEIDVDHFSNRSSGHESDDVEVIKSSGSDFTQVYQVYLDENGQVELDFMVASTATNEIVNIENIEVVYEGETGWMQSVTETETHTESVLVDAPGEVVDPSDIPGGVPTIHESREVEVEADPVTTTVSEVDSINYPVDISAALSDTDGSETLSVTITGVPEGASLNVGLDNGDGTWTIEVPAGETSIDMDSITLSVPPGNESFDLGIIATATESSTGDTQTATASDEVDMEADDVNTEISVDNATLHTEQGIDTDAMAEQMIVDNGDGTYTQYEETAKLYTTETIEVGEAETIRLDDAPDHGVVEINIDGEWTQMTVGEDYNADLDVRFTPDEEALSTTYDIGIGTFGENVGERDFSETVELSDWGDVAADGKSVTFTEGDLSVTTSVIQNGSEQNLGTYNSSGNSKGAGIGDNDSGGLSRGETLKVEIDGADVNQVSFQLDGLGGYFDESHSQATQVKITAYDEDGNVIDTQGGFRESGEYDDVYSFTTTVPVSHFELTTEGGNGNYVVQNMTLSQTVVDEVSFTATNADGEEISLTSDINIQEGMETTDISSLIPASDEPMTVEVRVVDTDAMADKGAIQIDGTWALPGDNVDPSDLPMTDVPSDVTYDVDLSASLTDTDGSETLSVTVTGVPEGGSLSVGEDNGDGTWSIDVQEGDTSIDLSNVTLTVPAGTEEFDLGVEATSTETSTGDTQTAEDSFSIDADSFDLDFDTVAEEFEQGQDNGFSMGEDIELEAGDVLNIGMEEQMEFFEAEEPEALDTPIQSNDNNPQSNDNGAGGFEHGGGAEQLNDAINDMMNDHSNGGDVM